MKQAGGVPTWKPRPAPPRTRAEELAERDLATLEDRRELELLERRPRGPNLPKSKRCNAGVYIQEFDLDGIIPDGWGREFLDNARLWDRQRLGFTQGAGFHALLCTLLSAFRNMRPPRRRASQRTLPAGFQLSPEWIARKLGCGERTPDNVLNDLDPLAAWRRETRKAKITNAKRKRQGLDPLALPKKPTMERQPLIARYSRPKLYATLTRDLPWAQRTSTWMDAGGVRRKWIDVTGYLYVTLEGVASVTPKKQRITHARATARGVDSARRRARAPGRAPQLRNLAAEDLARRMRKFHRHLASVRDRLKSPEEKACTPQNEQTSETSLYPGRDVLDLVTWDDTGPPTAGNGGHELAAALLASSAAGHGRAEGSPEVADHGLPATSRARALRATPGDVAASAGAVQKSGSTDPLRRVTT